VTGISTEHGGNPEALEALYGKPRAGWLDLSTGINPESYPVGEIAASDWRMLPTAALFKDLEDAARGYYGLPREAALVAAPGSQALIQWLPRFQKPGRVKVLVPTYGEHAPPWRAAGHRVEEVGAVGDLAGADVAVMVNPNNPDGRLTDPSALLSVGAELLVVDEAFMDPTPHMSLASRAGRPGLVILRSFGKFFGLAGLRLGFALTDLARSKAFAEALGPWAVSTPAARIAIRAFADQAWIAQQLGTLPEKAARLDKLLIKAGFAVVGGTGLYRLAQSDRAPQVFERLAQAGIAVRRFATDPHRLRFGLPGLEADWMRLAAALSAP
jgi:cobalamin biosynthetic protein CobC